MAKRKKTTPAAEPPPKGAGRAADKPARPGAPGKPAEIGGPKGPEPTRFGDWERGGICVDF